MTSKKPLIITIGGMSGTGKTTLASALAQELPNTLHLDSDRVRKELAGVSETTRLAPEAYTYKKNMELVDEMARRVKAGLEAGKTVIVSTAIANEKRRQGQEQIAKDNKAQLIGIMLQVDDVQTLFNRVSARKDDASDAGVDIVKMQQKYADGAGKWPVINASQPREKVLQDALKLIKKKRKTVKPTTTRKPK